MTELTVHTEDKVTIPAGQRMMVSTSDWSRVRGNVERLGESAFDRAATLGGTLVGAAVALLGVIASIERGSTQPASGLVTGL